MESETRDFHDWLERNREQFKSRSLEGIRDLAIACGFSLITVWQWYTSQSFKAAANE